MNSFYIFDPDNISCFIQWNISFVLKFKSVCDFRYFLLLHYISTTCQIKLVKTVVNEPDKSSITSQYLNNKRRQKRKIYQLMILHVQPAGGKITRFQNLIIDDPFYLCVLCSRMCLYKRYVIRFHDDQFEHLIPDMCSGWCLLMRKNKTCQKNKKEKCFMPSSHKQISNYKFNQSVLWYLHFGIKKKSFFKKMSIMPKVKSPKIKGSVWNVSVEITD